MNNADARDIRGLAVTGVGTVDCARHNMKQPNSIGDLQLGEKYILTQFDIYDYLLHLL
jgi:KDZ transposase-like protein